MNNVSNDILITASKIFQFTNASEVFSIFPKDILVGKVAGEVVITQSVSSIFTSEENFGTTSLVFKYDPGTVGWEA